MSIELTLSCDNSDLNRALLNGEVEPRGIDLTTTVTYPPRRHRRFFRQQEFDICEVCLASYVSSRTNPEAYPFTAIPVFPSRKFRHSFFYKHADADVDGPADLAGKSVGVQSWQTAANVWMRGIAQERYGLDLETVDWYRRREDDVPVELPERFDIDPVPGSQGGDAIEEPRDMKALLFEGELDAVMDPSGSLFRAVAAADEVEFMFDDPIATERQYYTDTGIHPPMHTVAIRDEILEENPWVAVSVYDAFREARDRALEWNTRPSYNMSLTWAHLHLLEQNELIGDRAWEYGLSEATRRELETFVGYAHDQGLIPSEYAPETLFVDSTLDV
ncbi:ABC transporter substrate-binding protein [Halapricum desulfuricans]|nr:ABC transporter substrate-binding protein [Halapricum desulfuricans]